MTASGDGRKRVLVVIGTRPEGIKLAPVVAALDKLTDRIETRIVLTGQHTTLIDQVLEVFDMKISWDLGIMREGQDLYAVVHACLDGLRDVVREWQPDMLVVEGDTASVFAGGLVGFFEHVSVAHVEAGLRSRDKWKPFPEEIFRRMTDIAADLHFAPTPGARDNLLAEGMPPEDIHVTGNTVVDAVQMVAGQPHKPSNPELQATLALRRPFVLVTAHRRESFGQPMCEAFSALRQIADRHVELELLIPVHPNPTVLATADELLRGHERIHLTAPLDYRDFIFALERAALVITDSGGIQEEAPSFGTPVLVMRDVTERPEGIRIEWLVGTDADLIVRKADELLRARHLMRSDLSEASDWEERRRPSTAASTVSKYGDGLAGERIADIIQHTLTPEPRTMEDWDGWSP
ncbi:MAG: UDP-N-acetylglucosamine 2-epimerase (non-hydrolyzing) [Gemmatimonadetes bacterium]|nr:UDP-N-acetylglucosamine 2-epimerase (non-hydrolyzing) [Gemmatimonadota bacterium]